MRIKIFFALTIAIVILFAVHNTYAQNNIELLDNRILYTKYTIADFFNDSTKWAWEIDVVYRRQSELGGSEIWSQPLRYSTRIWIAYQANKLTRLHFNPIGVFNSAPRMPLETDLNRSFERELRTTLQINNYAFYGRFNFTHRIRFESRWRGIDNPDGPIHNFRIRYRLRLRTPLNTDYFYTNNTLYLSKYSEMHIEFGKNIEKNYFSQNRNYIGLGYRFWDWTRVELGYIYQINFRGNVEQLDISRGPMFYLFIDILSRNNRKYKYSF
ncbi:MAG TPA: DUF2490 domain-containing protein [Saprospiraceae bacterium]|nr:DUF2490 domain-containing protein [Saprospiraceae bacterium]